MPLLSSNGDEFACNDEVKVYIDEGDEEEPKKITDSLTEDKQNLVIELEDHEKQSFSQEEKEKCDIFKLPYYGHLAMAAAAAYAQHNQQNRSSSPKSPSFLNPAIDFSNLQNPSKLSTYYPGLLQSPIAAAASLFQSNNNPLSIIGNSVNPFASFSPSFLTSAGSNSSSTSQANVKDQLDQLTSESSHHKFIKDVSRRVKSPNIFHSELLKAANLYNLTKSPKNNESKINSSDFGSSNDSLNWRNSSPIQLFNSSGVRSSSSNTSNNSGSNRGFSPHNMLSQVAVAAGAQFLSSLAAAAVACSESNSENCTPKISTAASINNSLLNFYHPYAGGTSTTSQSSHHLNLPNSTSANSSLYPGMTGQSYSQLSPMRGGPLRSHHGTSGGSNHHSLVGSFLAENFSEHEGKMGGEHQGKHQKTFIPFDTNNNKHGNHPLLMKDQVKGAFSSKKLDSDDRRSNKPHIKKPLNAFMLYMKEMRPKVQDECTLKESAAINQILGKKWHELPKEQQAKYYEMARKEKELHAQMFPGWSARDNYAMHSKRKKRRKMLIEQKSMGHQNSNFRMNPNPYPMHPRTPTSTFPMKQTPGNPFDLLAKDIDYSHMGLHKTGHHTPDQSFFKDQEVLKSPSTNSLEKSLSDCLSNGAFHNDMRKNTPASFGNENISSNQMGNNSDGTEMNSNSQSNSPMSSRENNNFSPGLQGSDLSHPKKCRARFGLDQQDKWCKPCRRKKKCIRYYLNGFDNDETALRGPSSDYAASNYGPDDSMPSLGGTSLISSANLTSEDSLRKRPFELATSGGYQEGEMGHFDESSRADNSLNLLNDLRMNFKLFREGTAAAGAGGVQNSNWPNLKFSSESFLSMQFENQAANNSKPIQDQLKP